MTLFGSVARLARLSSRRQLSTSAPRAGDHGWSYRTTPYPTSDFLAKASTGIMTFTWWWIFHGNQPGPARLYIKLSSAGIFTEPAHILPFWDNYPEPEKWTDAQLGIPPDDE